MHFDYTTLGHITVDLLADGSRQPGGTAFYSALQAARLGRRTLVVTKGRPDELEQLLEPYSSELELRVLPAAHTTTLATEGSGAMRTQRVLRWAGPLPEEIALDTDILHLAPVARETPTRWRGRARFLGLTPQGLLRSWDGDGAISLVLSEQPAIALAERCAAIVISEQERASCEPLIAAALAAGALVAITAEGRPLTLLGGPTSACQLPLAGVHEPRDELGAGDVFAAAFFVALAEGQQPRLAAAFAHAAAALRVQGLGAVAIAGRAAIEERLRDHRLEERPPA